MPSATNYPLSLHDALPICGTVPAPAPDRWMGRCPSRCGGFGFLGELAKRRRFAGGEVGEALAIELDARILQAEHELAVGESVLSRGGVDAHDPQAAIVALLPFAPDVRIDARFLGRLFHELVQLALVLEVPLGELGELLPLLTAYDAAFDAWHD